MRYDSTFSIYIYSNYVGHVKYSKSAGSIKDSKSVGSIKDNNP